MEKTFGGLLVKNASTYFNNYSSSTNEHFEKEDIRLSQRNDSNIILNYFLGDRKNEDLIADKSMERIATQYYKNVNNFEFLLSILWLSGFPCNSEAENSLLKECSWKGIKIPCGLIFSKSITDIGICCSFNMARASEIFFKSTFSKTIQELQQLDQISSATVGDIPSWYIYKQDPKIKLGENIGLYLVIDSRSNVLENLSVESDFKSLDFVIGRTGKQCC